MIAAGKSSNIQKAFVKFHPAFTKKGLFYGEQASGCGLMIRDGFYGKALPM